jgi:hypothetical protein
VHAELARVLAALVPDLGAATGEPVALDGGITNRNFRITLAQAGDVVVRLPGKDTELLGIDREAERAATAAAAATGVGPRVVAFRTEPPCLVTAFIPGAPIPPEALRGRRCAHASTRSRSSTPTAPPPSPAARRSRRSSAAS